jgi:hypothetical protein
MEGPVAVEDTSVKNTEESSEGGCLQVSNLTRYLSAYFSLSIRPLTDSVSLGGV